MKDYLEFISSNSLTSGLVCAVVISMSAWLWNYLKNISDRNKVSNFLKESRINTSHIFRSTEAIAAATKLTESRVEAICTKHPKISRNTAEKQSWRLGE